jgi:membrane protease YdiL (CAAX protease family)
MRVVWQLVAVTAVFSAGGLAVARVREDPWVCLVVGLLVSVASVHVYRWVVGRTEHRSPVELAGPRAGAALGRGALAGVGLFGLVIATIALLGGYSVEGLGSVSGAVGLIGLMAAAAVTEELLFRGVLFRLLEERTGTWVALVVTGLVFGLMHLFNPDATLWGALAIAIEAGALLTAAYVATRRLWVPIGLHFGWNFAQGGIFGTKVSGNGTSAGLLDSTMSGPTVLTGGAFGPEGSVLSVVVCVLAAAVFMVMARRRGNVVPLRRSVRTQAVRDLRVATLPR